GREDLHDDGDFTANDGYAKENPDAVAFDVLGGDGADLGSDGCAQQHDQRGYDFDAALVTVGGGSIETGDGDFKKIGTNGHVGGDAHQIDQGGHADQAAANPEHTRQPAGKEADPDGQPQGTANAGALEIDHGRDIDFLQPLVPLMASGHGVQFLAHRQGLALLPLSLGDVAEYHPGDQGEEHNVGPADIQVDFPDALQPHDHLGADLDSADRTQHHRQPELVVHVPELGVPHRGNQRLASHVGDIGANGKVHRKTQDVQPWGYHPRSAHAEKTADNTDAKAQNDQARPKQWDAGDGHESVQPIHDCLRDITANYVQCVS